MEEEFNNSDPSEFRKAQEEILNLIRESYYKEMIRLQKVMFEEYLASDFTREEALKLVMSFTGRSS